MQNLLDKAPLATELSFYDSLESDCGPTMVRLTFTADLIRKVEAMREVLKAVGAESIAIKFNAVEYLEEFDEVVPFTDFNFEVGDLHIYEMHCVYEAYPRNADLRFYSEPIWS